MEDILTKVASFLNIKQLFVVSRVSKVWNEATFYSKRDKMLEIKKEIHRAHMCNNSCEKNQLFACADLNTSRSCVWSVGINPNGCNRWLAVTFSGLMLPTGLYYTQIKETLPQQLVRSSFLTQTMLESIVIPGTDQWGNYSFEIQISGQNLSWSPINCSLANIVMK